MKKGQNFNHPSKGSRIKIEPIRQIEDVEKIKKYLTKNPRNSALFAIGVNTCLRPVDLLSIRIGQALGINSTGKIEVTERKTGKTRTVSLNRACVETVNTLLDFKRNKEKRALDSDDFLFYGRGGPLSLPSMNLLVKKWCNRTNLTGNFGSHTLRKTFGYQKLIYDGAGLNQIMERFNHSNKYQTFEYLGISPEEISRISFNGKRKKYEIISDRSEKIINELEWENARLKKKVEELESRSEQLNIIIENAKDAIVLIDDKGYCTDATESSVAFSGITREELKGKHFSEVGFMSPETAQKCIERIQEAPQGKPARPMEFKGTRKDGTSLVIEVNPKIIKKDGVIIGYLAIIRDTTRRKYAEDVLLKHKDDLEQMVKERTNTLEESNTALKVLLKKGDEVKQEIEDKILFNIKELIYPYLEKIKKSRLGDPHKTYIDIIASNLDNIVSPFMHGISTRYMKITPREIQIANLIRQGKTSKEIAQLLNMSPRTIDTHRYNIRKKIGLNSKEANLRTYLLSSN